METGSGLLTESGSSRSNASSPRPAPPPPRRHDHYFNGLNFGKKIDFEDHGGSGGGGVGLGSSPSSSSSRPKAKPPVRRSVQGGGGPHHLHQQQPPRCQVEGCKADLSEVKPYYSRHKVCGVHSKSSKVIVAGLEQRFCQQCSRFHQLPEFDQGKRSCRRRLAGHNERRRKPQPGSVLSSQSGRLSSALSENGTRSGSFILDFSSYSRLFQRDALPTARSSEWLLGNETHSMGRPIPHPWQISSQNPPSNFYLHGSAGGTGFPSSGIRPGECFTGVGNTDSSRALSLLSNHQWGAKSQASSVVHNLVNAQGASGNQSTAHHGAPVNQYPSPSWGYKGNEASSSSHDMGPDLVLGQISQPMNDQFSVELELSHHDTRLYMGLEHSRGYDSSTQHMHWSL